MSLYTSYISSFFLSSFVLTRKSSRYCLRIADSSEENGFRPGVGGRGQRVCNKGMSGVTGMFGGSGLTNYRREGKGGKAAQTNCKDLKDYTCPAKSANPDKPLTIFRDHVSRLTTTHSRPVTLFSSLLSLSLAPGIFLPLAATGPVERPCFELSLFGGQARNALDPGGAPFASRVTTSCICSWRRYCLRIADSSEENGFRPGVGGRGQQVCNKGMSGVTGMFGGSGLTNYHREGKGGKAAQTNCKDLKDYTCPAKSANPDEPLTIFRACLYLCRDHVSCLTATHLRPVTLFSSLLSLSLAPGIFLPLAATGPVESISLWLCPNCWHCSSQGNLTQGNIRSLPTKMLGDATQLLALLLSQGEVFSPYIANKQTWLETDGGFRTCPLAFHNPIFYGWPLMPNQRCCASADKNLQKPFDASFLQSNLTGAIILFHHSCQVVTQVGAGTQLGADANNTAQISSGRNTSALHQGYQSKRPPGPVFYTGKYEKTTRGYVQKIKYFTPDSLLHAPSAPAQHSQQAQFDHDVDTMVIDEFAVPFHQRTSGKSQNDYLREWVARRDKHLEVTLVTEAPPPGMVCVDCGKMASKFRCLDCALQPVYCRACCRQTHRRLHTHRVQYWNGRYFRTAGLWETGLVLNLGHNGSPCPNFAEFEEQENERQDASCEAAEAAGPAAPTSPVGQTWAAPETWAVPAPIPIDLDIRVQAVSDDLLGEDESMEADADVGDDGEDIKTEPSDQDGDNAPQPDTEDSLGNPFVLVIETNGIHHLPLHLCTCPGAAPTDEQLLTSQLFPTSFQNVKTLFTFKVLDDFRLSNLTCKTSAYQYYLKLRRLTSPAFPKSVPVHIALVDILECCLTHHPRTGIANSEEMPKAGEMAYGCASCAQPGVNLPMNWKEDPHPEVFTRFLCVDGNFSADHLKQRNAMDDVWLTSGEGMMTEKEAYKKYLAQPTVTHQVKSTCSNHQAINNASQNHAGCDATGIAAFACPRSGAFIPGSVVDFQKGERQLNINYALCEALKNMGLNGLDDIMIIYDVMCQYHVNLWDRIANNPNLSISEKANLIMGIGLFHVHGHQDECLFWLATSFIPGAGMVDGEILESLWAQLNDISRSTRTATLAHWAKVLDDHMNDSNWNKMVNIVSSVIAKYRKAVVGLVDSKDYFDQLNSSAGEHNHTWQAEIRAAESDRAQGNLKAMDIMAPRNPPNCPAPLTTAQVQLKLMDQERLSMGSTGQTSWIATGLKIEETQIELRFLIRRTGKKPTILQKVDIAKRRERLRVRIDAFNKMGMTFLAWNPALNENQLLLREEFDMDDVLQMDDDLAKSNFSGSAPDIMVVTATKVAQAQAAALAAAEAVEHVKLALPSAMGEEHLQAHGLQHFLSKEYQLRQGQVNDALQGVRVSLANLSFEYGRKLRKIKKSKVKKTRAWATVHAVGQTLHHHRQIYSYAIDAISRLGDPEKKIGRQYKPLLKEDMKANTAVADPNARGQSRAKPAWFWSSNLAGDMQDNERMVECKASLYPPQ
ncbi:uncharacterized protein LACBIDRAFT_325386 [Laccaria bicolor S238N-H82]|uniref:Predicted protein n=1 Tax=Laccaria bicolor (strain S238N-H82 / ATCC MYA-4686) TaxID=486041 RepID=B0D4R6_LACBS|nr:uncharacterized protein LACBIDRAFT_325386 [Laccaria bicolor S238N-H82]EDR10391.1 predicted protein [Laccaria bicolor S238N-H82]|eukprot:XP_001878841.1 predicted protein [Laccaria bicolor S238N-H82]